MVMLKRPDLSFDEVVKRVVGLNVDIDLAFVLENPNPTTEFLKQAVVTEASVSFLTTLGNEIAMPCSVEYMSKAGEYTTQKFKSEARRKSSKRMPSHCVPQTDLCLFALQMASL